ncbi:unnamed protein product [Allacma fusca]|uniref:Uncharacterized protein n=1 Tax=Allacma fusca TaxID=39272 RepID=A0A8J2KAJ5_9HEXA|nr:unnamed protein product [Allacma fusca]
MARSVIPISGEDLADGGYLNHHCLIFRSFVEGIVDTGCLSHENRRRSVVHLQKSLESICSAINIRFLSPLAVAENIVLHTYSGSKMAVEMFSRCQPAGSYSFIQKLVQKLALESPKLPNYDVCVVFDNQQVIGRKKYSYTALPSTNIDELWKLYEITVDNFKTVHEDYKQKGIRARFAIVKRELINKLDIATAVKVDNYSAGLEYGRVECTESSFVRTDLESILVNPNSSGRIQVVLDHIIDLVQSSNPNRKWIVVQCDGLPFTMATRLIADTHYCTTCKTQGSQLLMSQHRCLNSQIERKYAKIIMRPGYGHFEINFVRSIFKNYFDVFIGPIAKLFGFTSPNSLAFCKSAKDHHQSWQLLQIIFIALTDELAYFYISSFGNTALDVNEDTFPQLSSNFEHKLQRFYILCFSSEQASDSKGIPRPNSFFEIPSNWRTAIQAKALIFVWKNEMLTKKLDYFQGSTNRQAMENCELYFVILPEGYWFNNRSSKFPC